MLLSILFWAVTNSGAVAASVPVAGSVRLFVDSPLGILQQKRKYAHCQPRILARDGSGMEAVGLPIDLRVLTPGSSLGGVPAWCLYKRD
jgi:hypothetical protein